MNSRPKGLTPWQEQRSLNEDPLPISSIDLTIPSHIAAVDNEISILTEKLKLLELQRQELLESAQKYGIFEDALYRIKHIVKKMRSINVLRFRELYPGEYDQIIALQKKQAIEKAELSIPLATANRFVDEDDMMDKEVFDITERESWKVEKK
jgi:hypothetical protein